MKRHSSRNSSGATLRKPTKRVGVSRILAQLRSQGVLLTEPRDIRAYLEKHIRLARQVPSICEAARAEFGPGTELDLKVNRDIESSERTLRLHIRQVSYDHLHFMDRIDRVSRQFDDALYGVPGYLLLTTDFRPPRGRDGV